MSYIFIEQDSSHWYLRLIENDFSCKIALTSNHTYVDLLKKVSLMSVDYHIECIAFIVDDSSDCARLKLVGMEDKLFEILDCKVLYIVLSASKEFAELYNLFKNQDNSLCFVELAADQNKVENSIDDHKVKLRSLALKTIFEKVYRQEFSLTSFFQGINQNSKLLTIFECYIIQLMNELKELYNSNQLTKIILYGELVQTKPFVQYIKEHIPLELAEMIIVDEFDKDSFTTFVLDKLITNV